MSLRHIRAFERDFDIVVERVDGKRKVTVSDGEKILVNKLIKEGDMIKVNLFH
jgi:hypothetical protein